PLSSDNLSGIAGPFALGAANNRQSPSGSAQMHVPTATMNTAVRKDDGPACPQPITTPTRTPGLRCQLKTTLHRLDVNSVNNRSVVHDETRGLSFCRCLSSSSQSSCSSSTVSVPPTTTARNNRKKPAPETPPLAWTASLRPMFLRRTS